MLPGGCQGTHNKGGRNDDTRAKMAGEEEDIAPETELAAEGGGVQVAN